VASPSAVASSPSKARIALFGTSADPPTCGHRALLEGLLRLYPRVATWASDNPLKQHGASLPLRVELLGALVASIGDGRLSLEQDLSSPWTIETLARAARRWPDHERVFVVGSDLLAQIPSWRQAEQLLSGGHLAVAPRQGWPVREADLERLRRCGASIDLLPLDIPASASRLVREAPGGHADPRLVPSELWPLLQRHGLYGLAEPSQPP